MRVAEVDGQPRSDSQLDVLSHLRALVPRERAAQLRGQLDDRCGNGVPDRLRTVAGKRWAVLHPRLPEAGHTRQMQ